MGTWHGETVVARAIPAVGGVAVAGPRAERGRRRTPRAIPTARSASSCRSRPAGRRTSLARIIGQKLSEDWKQPVLVENRVGANTVIGAQVVATAPVTATSLLMAIDSTLTMNQFLYKSLPYRSDPRFRAGHRGRQDRGGADGERSERPSSRSAT